MSIGCYLTCVTSDGGIPLFSRAHGDLPPLPFPVLGSLNGVHMFAKSQSARLENCVTENAKVVWKEFHQSIKLTLISFDQDAVELHCKILLENLFHAMVLVVGLEELQVITKIEKLKKTLKCCYPLLDTLLQRCTLFGDLCQCTDIIICPDSAVVQGYLDAFVEACESEFGFILVYGKVVVATERWWQLNPLETMLTLMFIQSLPACSCRDIPIYLPLVSPKIPHRLITLEISENVEVCVICGPQPTLQEIIDNNIERFWTPVLDNLRAFARCHPRNIPVSITVDSNILGFILMNTEEGKCLASVFPDGTMTGSEQWTTERRTRLLLSFFGSISGALFPVYNPLHSVEGVLQDESADSKKSKTVIGDVLETYWYTCDCKCYAVCTDIHQIFVLFNNDIPVYALSPTTTETLRILTKDNLI